MSERRQLWKAIIPECLCSHFLRERNSSAFMACCSNTESWWNAHFWEDDRLGPCKHISLMSPSPIFAARLCARVGEQRQRVPTCFVNCNFLFCNSTIKTTMVRQMLSQICSRGSVVRAVRFVSERLLVLIQTARFCPSGTSAPTLFKSSETKPSLSCRHCGLPPRG